MGDAAVGIRAFFSSQNQDRSFAEAADAAQYRGVVGESAIAGQRGEVRDQSGNIIGRLRPVRVAGNLGFLPGGQFGVCRAQLPIRDRREPGDLFCDIKAVGLR